MLSPFSQIHVFVNGDDNSIVFKFLNIRLSPNELIVTPRLKQRQTLDPRAAYFIKQTQNDIDSDINSGTRLGNRTTYKVKNSQRLTLDTGLKYTGKQAKQDNKGSWLIRTTWED